MAIMAFWMAAIACLTLGHGSWNLLLFSTVGSSVMAFQELWRGPLWVAHLQAV